MEILQIAVIGLTAALFGLWLKGYGAVYSTLLSLAGCLLIFYFGVRRLSVVLQAVDEIQSYIQVNGVYMAALLKIIGITYIAEFSSALCKDAGYGAIAGQIEMAAKLSILAVSMPVLLALLETVQNLLL